MVSLVNGNTDVLTKDTVQFARKGSDEADMKKDGGIEPDQEVTRSVRSPTVSTKQVTESDLAEVSCEIKSKVALSIAENSMIVSESDRSEDVDKTTERDLCNGSDTSLPSICKQTLVNSDGNEISESMNAIPASPISTPNVGNVFFVGNVKHIGKGDNQRNVYLLNNSMVKGNATEIPTEHINSGVTRKMKVSPNSDGISIKDASTVPSFVQLSQSNMKNISRNITLNVTPTSTNSVVLKPNKQSYEILRAKLMENRVENSEPTLVEIPAIPTKPRTILKTSINTSFFNVPKFSNESPAVTEARNDFIRCRKKLIEAAIYPKLTTKVPLPGYVGPTFSCEECEDTFVTEESLKSHKDRRSVLFTYACPSCKQTLEFYNRCMFLLHVRSHDSAVKACFLTISTIPSNKLKFRVLDDDDELSTVAEERVLISAPTNVVSSALPSVTPKCATKSVEKTDFSTVRIVKSLKKKKQPLTTMMEGNVNDDPQKEEPSSLRSLLVSESGPKQFKSQGESSKSDETTLTAREPGKLSVKRRKKSSEVVGRLKPVLDKSVSETSPVEVAKDSSEVIANKGKCEATVGDSAVNNNVEEITLTSSDEEEDSLPESNDKSKLVTCRECKEEVLNLTQHYRGDNRPKKEYPCEQCKYFNSSACALSAHVRMHAKAQPYVCPDCGYFFSTLETFLVHVKQVCFYDFKAIRFKCPACPVLKPSVPKFFEHLRREHTREVFKCDACMTSSYSSAVVEAHIKKTHENPETISILEGYWCKLCPNMLVSKQLIDHHINKHVYSLQHLRYVYICKMCKNYASNRRSKFADHYHSVCAPPDEIVTELKIKKTNRKRKRGEHKLTGKSKNIFNTTNIAEVAGKNSLPIEDWESNTGKRAFGSTDVCIMCRKSKVSEQSSLFCHQCVHSVDAEDAAISEITSTEGISRFKRKFKCKLCKQCMNRDWTTITKHFEVNHHSDFDVRARIRSSSDPNSVLPNRKRKILTKTQEKDTSKTDVKYKCAKCNTIMKGRKQFHEHIATHKSQSDFQCLECGLCFIVRLSLEKHLIVEHKIRHSDLNEYFRANGIAVMEEKMDEQVLVENQCEVCRLECATKQNYDKHIRTHGMAFVAMQSKAKT